MPSTNPLPPLTWVNQERRESQHLSKPTSMLLMLSPLQTINSFVASRLQWFTCIPLPLHPFLLLLEERIPCKLSESFLCKYDVVTLEGEAVACNSLLLYKFLFQEKVLEIINPHVNSCTERLWISRSLFISAAVKLMFAQVLKAWWLQILWQERRGLQCNPRQRRPMLDQTQRPT